MKRQRGKSLIYRSYCPYPYPEDGQPGWVAINVVGTVGYFHTWREAMEWVST